MITNWLVAIVSALTGVVVIVIWVESMFVTLVPIPAPSWGKRNRAVLTHPSVGMDLILLAPIALLRPGTTPQVLLLLPFLLLALVGLIGLLPLPLPRWMYPTWRIERRKQLHRWLTETANTWETTPAGPTEAAPVPLAPSGQAATPAAPAPCPDPADIPWPLPEWRRDHRKARRARRPQQEKNQRLINAYAETASMTAGTLGLFIGIF